MQLFPIILFFKRYLKRIFQLFKQFGWPYNDQASSSYLHDNLPLPPSQPLMISMLNA